MAGDTDHSTSWDGTLQSIDNTEGRGTGSKTLHGRCAADTACARASLSVDEPVTEKKAADWSRADLLKGSGKIN